MKIALQSEIPYEQGPKLRGPNALVRILLQGRSGTPTNFEIGIKTFQNEGNGSPRHTHAFDQFRYAISGEFEYDKPNGKVIPEGCIGYFPEGTPYGPFKIDPKSIFLTIQFGGPSGYGFVHKQDMAAAQTALAREGTFEKGIYTYVDERGVKHNRDSHKVAWERASGCSDFKMPGGRYKEPILILPHNYPWREIGAGVDEKFFGSYNERGTYAKMLRIAAGSSYTREAGKQENIFFVTEGAVSIDQAEVLQKHDVMHLEPSEGKTFSALATTTLLVYGLPAF